MTRLIVSLSVLVRGIALCGFVSIAAMAEAYQIAPEAACLSRLTTAADTIIDGEVLSAESVYLPSPSGGQLPATRYTFHVNAAFKGDATVEETLTVDQFGWRKAPAGERVRIPPLGASYAVGGRYVLFLYGKSELGLQNAVGFNYGRFTVSSAPDGRLTVQNGVDNVGLTACGETADTALSARRAPLERIAVQSREGGAIAYDTFIAAMAAVK